MAGARVTPERIEQVRQIIKDAGLTWERAASNTCGKDRLAGLLNIGPGAAGTLLDKLRRPDQVSTELLGVESAVSGDAEETQGDRKTITRTGINERIVNEKQLIAFCGIDTTEWEVERWICNKWEVGAKDSSGEITVRPLYQVKVWLRRKVAVIAARDEIDAMLDQLASKAPIYPPIKRRKAPGDLMLELSFPDVHLGKRAWGKETGWDDYDSYIGEEDARNAAVSLLSRVAGYKFKEIWFVVGHDLLNADSSANTTTKGTPQDVDDRHLKTFRLAWRLNVWIIEQLRELAPVHVLVVPGNHDQQSCLHLGDVISAWFRNTKDVAVDAGPTLRKYRQWGNVGLMFFHGGNMGKTKLKELPNVMAAEARTLWGSTRWNEIHCGDKHHVYLEERYGCRVRILPSLCPPDAWHSENLYVGAVRSAEAYVWSKSEGLVATAHHSILPKVSAA